MSSPIHRLHALRQQGSTAFRSDTPESKTGAFWDFLNSDHALRQKRTEGSEKSNLGQNAARNHRQREEHCDDVATDSAKYGHEVQRTMVDTQLEKRAQSFLRNHECTELFGSVAALEIANYYVDDVISRMKKNTNNKEILEVTQPEVLLLFERALSKIRTLSCGPKYNPQWTDATEFFK